jgi:plasmid stability protein
MRMPTLHVRNVPAPLYKALKAAAAENDSSISAEVLRLLTQALRTDRASVRKLLAEVDRDHPKLRAGAPSAAALIRADRDRR